MGNFLEQRFFDEAVPASIHHMIATHWFAKVHDPNKANATQRVEPDAIAVHYEFVVEPDRCDTQSRKSRPM